MTARIGLAVSEAEAAAFGPAIAEACRRLGLDVTLVGPEADPGAIDYLVLSPDGPVEDFAPFTRARAAFSLFAGVERIAPNPTLALPLARMVDPGLTAGMVDYVLAHVLRHHVGTDTDVLGGNGHWRPRPPPPLAAERNVAVLGLGALGGAVARALAGLGFRVLGWSRRQAALPGIECRAGEDGLSEVLASAEILVTLLPATAATDDLLDAARLALLPRGAVLINPGRGNVVVEADLLAALDAGHLAHATLDVFREEPLPPGHPFWAHARITVTPHIASLTRPATAAPVIAENIRRAEAGEPLLHLVDRAAGY